MSDRYALLHILKIKAQSRKSIYSGKGKSFSFGNWQFPWIDCGSDKKIRLRIKELERIYGIEHGGDRTQHEKNSSCKTQTDLASYMNMSIDTLQNYRQNVR